MLMEGEILSDLVEEHRSAEIANCEKVSVADVRGDPEMKFSLLKRCLFLHPPSGEATAATATYSLRLPRLGKQEKLLFLFAVGLKPGWREADKEGADGVVFRVLVNGERVFEELWDRDGWCFSAVDLSPHGGELVRLTLVSDRNRNSSADWALWGDARVVLMRPLSRSLVASPSPNFFVFRASGGKQFVAEWPGLGPAGTGVIRPSSAAPRGALAWFPTRPSLEGEARLPQMRLPDGSSPGLADIAAVSYGPKVELVSIGQSPAVIRPYDGFDIIVALKNAGEGALTAERALEAHFGLPAGFRFADGETASKSVRELRPSEETMISWRLNAPAETGKFQFAVGLGVATLRTFDIAVYPAGRGIDYGYVGDDPSGLHVKDGFIVLEKGNKRLAFVRDNERFLYGVVLVKVKEGWRTLGHLTPFAEFSIRLRNGSTEKIEVRPSRHVRLTEAGGRTLTDDELAIRFDETFADGDSVQWQFQQSFLLRRESPWVEVETSISPDAPREVLLFAAPKLLAGDGSFGASKDQALFPGLEYLGKDEPSSGTRDIALPQSKRFTPHPLRVTIPLMAVREGETIVGISWDPLQKWCGDKQMPTPLFSSPNRFPVQGNHLMSVLVPSVPESLEEGTLNTRRALSLDAKQTIRLKASILLVSGAADVTDAVTCWVREHGLPSIEYPRSPDEEIELCRDGFLSSVWDESAQGWSHCVGWVPGPYPGYCTLLNMDYFLSRNEQVRQTLRDRIDLVVANCLKRLGPGSLWRPDACHILTGELPFLEGRLARSLEDWERAAGRILATQSPDGSWRWRPDEKRASLGKPGDTTSGMCARGACQVLRSAIVTGNAKHVEGALKGLAFLDRYTIPTGAQEWECPIYAPDVLAAGYAVQAFVVAHEITGDARYLDKARFWARTGIPFVYLWSYGENVPQMPYGGIPIFGASFYAHSWLGRPVQWCALVYAYSLIQLSRYDSSFDWRRLAEGITVSAMWQQYADGKSKGCYPDSWDMLENHPNPPDLNPENILVNLLTLTGHDPGLKHRVLNRDGNPIFVTSIAEILSADVVGNGIINVRLKFFPGVRSYVLVAGLPSGFRPDVVLNGKPLRAAEDVDAVPAGFSFLAEKGWLVVAVAHSEEPDTLQIRGSF